MRERNFLQLADRVDAQRLQGRLGDFADPRNSAHGERGEKCSFASRSDPDETSWLSLIAGDFCDEARGAKPAGARQTCSCGDFEQQFVSGRERRSMHALCTSEVEIGFVNRGHLDDRRKLPENRGYAIAPFAIELMVA